MTNMKDKHVDACVRSKADQVMKCEIDELAQTTHTPTANPPSVLGL